MSGTIDVALIHCPLIYGELAGKPAKLREPSRKAAGLGAKTIVNPKPDLIGYGFDPRAEIAPLVRVIDSPVVRSLGALAATRNTYLNLYLFKRGCGIERLTVAMARDDGCLTSSPPESHQRGALLEAQNAGDCHLSLDTSQGRHKPYEERLDCQLLSDQIA